MIWFEFALAALIIVLAAVKLSEFGDVIAQETGLGGLFVGTLLMAMATSLPEILTMITAIRLDHIDLTAGDLFGSCMFNMLLLGVLDMAFYQSRILRRVALKHALTASLGTMLLGMAVFFILARIDVQVGWVGIGSLLMIATYAVGLYLLRNNGAPGIAPEDEPLPEEERPAHRRALRNAVIGFALAAGVLVLAAPHLVRSAGEVAEITGLGDGMVGTVLIALVTSLPELVVMIAAVRLGALDLAVGNLFGSNVFNMFALALADVFYTQGSFLNAISPAFALAGLLAMLMAALALIGNLAQVERRIWIVEIDAALLILAYIAGIYFLYLRGIGI